MKVVLEDLTPCSVEKGNELSKKTFVYIFRVKE
jgi:hypothetical protein